jgi:signal transduction histidine kinase
MVEETAFLLSPEMERAQVAYTQEVAPDLEAYVDAEQIKRALFNLMKNAVQAMEPGGTLTVRAKAVEEEEAIEVEVVDNGPGIPAPVRARLFEPFFTTREKGSGLGLAIVRQSLEKNGGWVRLESIEGEGTTVRVFLPAGRIPIAEMEST